MPPSFWPEPRRLSRLELALLALLATAAVGCGPACDTSDDAAVPQIFGGGTATDGVYESSPWNRDLLAFPGGKQYKLEHHLGFTPAAVHVYVGFRPDADRVSLCAGNSCLVVCADNEIVQIKNDTCADFWVRVVTTGKSFVDGRPPCNPLPPGVDGSFDPMGDGGIPEDDAGG